MSLWFNSQCLDSYWSKILNTKISEIFIFVNFQFQVIFGKKSRGVFVWKVGLNKSKKGPITWIYDFAPSESDSWPLWFVWTCKSRQISSPCATPTHSTTTTKFIFLLKTERKRRNIGRFWMKMGHFGPKTEFCWHVLVVINYYGSIILRRPRVGDPIFIIPSNNISRLLLLREIRITRKVRNKEKSTRKIRFDAFSWLIFW